MAETEIGTVTHYYTKLGVAGIKLSNKLTVGDRIHILGHTTDLTQPVESIEVEHGSVPFAAGDDEIGLKVADHVREHDKVFRVD